MVYGQQLPNASARANLPKSACLFNLPESAHKLDYAPYPWHATELLKSKSAKISVHFDQRRSAGKTVLAVTIFNCSPKFYNTISFKYKTKGFDSCIIE